MIELILKIVMGWVAGVVINYLSDVLPFERKLVSSSCPDCQGKLDWDYYVLLRACPSCGKRPSPRHLVVFISGPVLGGLLDYFPMASLGSYGGLLWLTYFGLVTIIDLEHRLILHPVSLVGAGMAAVFGILNRGFLETFLGGAGGFGIMLGFYFLGIGFVKLVSKTRNEEIDEIALGFGDVNLAGVIGLLLGWPGVIGGIFLAIILGGVVSGVYLLIQRMRNQYRAFQALPYGPFLVVSTLALFYLSQFIE